MNIPYWLAAIRLPSINSRTILQWLTHFHSPQALLQATREDLLASGMSPRHIELLKQPDWRGVEQDLAWAQQPHHHLIAWDDERYPCLLKEIADPPLMLYVQGNVQALSQTQIAIVGSRHATQGGLDHAYQFAAALASAHVTITSGLALGIDGAAHRGALSVNGMTLGVTGTGLHHVYPASHRALYQAVLANNGAIISEFPLETRARPENFPRRNRIISGLSTGVLVVEAALKSGSLVTARLALEQGREVFAIPGSIRNPLTQGCHHLIRQGAKLVETPTDIVEELGPLIAVVEGANQSSVSSLSTQAQAVLQEIGYEVTPLDVILLKSQLTPGEVSSALLTLELDGHIQSIVGGYVRS